MTERFTDIVIEIVVKIVNEVDSRHNTSTNSLFSYTINIRKLMQVKAFISAMHATDDTISQLIAY